MLLFYPVSFGLAISSKLDVNFFLFICFFLIGAIIMRSAGCIINDIWDKDIDSKVDRTKTRPLASGEISLTKAIICLVILLFLFVIMMLDVKIASATKDFLKYFPFGGFIGTIFLIEILLSVPSIFEKVNPYNVSFLFNYYAD